MRGSMDAVRNLLVLYLGILLLPTALSAAMWARRRTPLHRALFVLFASNLVPAATQVALHEGALFITIGFAFVFVVNLALANLIAAVTGVPLRWRPMIGVLAVGIVATFALHAAGAGFTAIALPVSVAVALPCLAIAGAIVRRPAPLTLVGRALVLSSVLFSLHNLDFAFLRDRPDMAPVGFIVAILITASIAITAPAVVLEIVTVEQGRIAAEMDAARMIQVRLLPKEAGFGQDVALHMRPAESVGGDYLDICQVDGATWFVVGDVTGHGLGAGLVMLMVQSTLRSILRALPHVSPRELGYLANEVLTDNLRRLGEPRHVSVVLIRRAAGTDRYEVCGSYENLYIGRVRTGRVETMELKHFPLGLGMIEDLGPNDFGEESVRLDPGDVIFLATDGVVEAAREGDFRRGVFGERALVDLLARHLHAPLADLKAEFVRALDEFTGGAYTDDIAFLLLRA
jgi:serine phosphatase RsbU (regulator of sigma subunit)